MFVLVLPHHFHIMNDSSTDVVRVRVDVMSDGEESATSTSGLVFKRYYYS